LDRRLVRWLRTSDRREQGKERNAGGGAIWQQHLPVIYPCHLPMLVLVRLSGQARAAAHKRVVELEAGTGSPDVNTVAKRTS